MPDSEPLAKLEPNGRPSVINYNVPEPTSYPGENLIKLKLDKSWFTEAAFLIPESDFDNLETPAKAVNPAGKITKKEFKPASAAPIRRTPAGR